jgi:hypothetical protein
VRYLVFALALLACGACRKTPDPVAAAEAECRATYDKLMRWVTGHGRFPVSDEDWEQVEPGKDPWGNAYVIAIEGEAQVYSWGPDGRETTDDDICYPPLE